MNFNQYLPLLTALVMIDKEAQGIIAEGDPRDLKVHVKDPRGT